MSKSHQEVASNLLTHHQGNQRSAEVEAWSCRDKNVAPGADFWVQVALDVALGREFPVVDRSPYQQAAPAFKAIEL